MGNRQNDENSWDKKRLAIEDIKASRKRYRDCDLKEEVKNVGR